MLLILFASCKKNIDNEYTILTNIPDGFPSIEVPSDNQFTIERWNLGKDLFYEKMLSIDSSVSCATCHKQVFGFSDNVSKTKGVYSLAGSRNAPTLSNIGFQPYFTKEGGVATLEQQVLIPIEEHNEMGFNILDAGLRLNKIATNKEKSIKSYQREMDYYVITRAISCFERSLISSNSAYDLWLNEEGQLNSSALRGKDLFYSSKTNCSSCHSDILFTNFGFYNNGLYQEYEDKGRFRLTQDSIDIGTFKVPTLRNIAVSAPYMHDGSLNTLRDVLKHYNSGGNNHANKSKLIKTLNLNESEINDLISFLESLTDYEFINNKILKNE
ncbi:MAG: cytochrome-c peroxidase [Chitinophagales bacterium]